MRVALLLVLTMVFLIMHPDPDAVMTSFDVRQVICGLGMIECVMALLNKALIVLK